MNDDNYVCPECGNETNDGIAYIPVTADQLEVLETALWSLKIEFNVNAAHPLLVLLAETKNEMGWVY